MSLWWNLLRSGRDLNADGALTEDEAESESLLCQQPANQGIPWLIITRTSEKCGDTGGIIIEGGYDNNQNGTLEASETLFGNDICNGLHGFETLVRTTPSSQAKNVQPVACALRAASISIETASSTAAKSNQISPAATRFRRPASIAWSHSPPLRRKTVLLRWSANREWLRRRRAGVARNGVLEPEEIESTALICAGEDASDSNPPIIERVDPGSADPMGGQVITLDGQNLLNSDGSFPAMTLGGRVITAEEESTASAPKFIVPALVPPEDLYLGRLYGNVLERITVLRDDGRADYTMLFYNELRCHGHFTQSDRPAGFACFDDHCMVTTNNNGIREGPEECDGSDFGDATCESMGAHFEGGTLACNAFGGIDVSNCTLAHPDGEPEDTNEACGDAIDNDHDGVADCDDPDVARKRCVEMKTRFSTPMAMDSPRPMVTAKTATQPSTPDLLRSATTVWMITVMVAWMKDAKRSLSQQTRR